MAFKFSDEYEEYKKKRKQEEQEQRTQQQKANFENFHNSKRSVMNQVSDVIQKNAGVTNKNKINTSNNMAKHTEAMNSYNRNTLQNNIINKVRTSIWDDIVGIAKNMGYGAKSGLTQIPKMLNVALENGKSGNYIKQTHRNMFMSNPNISRNIKQEVIFQDKKNAPIFSNNISNINTKPIITNKNINGQIQKEREQYLNTDGKIETNLFKKELQDSINNDNKKIQENADKMSNGVSEYLARNLAPSIGQMGVGAVASAIHPVLGATYFTTSSSGSYFDDAKQRGMNDSDASKYGVIMGAIEGATEMIGIGNFQKAGKGVKTLIKGTGKTALKEGTEQLTKNTLKSALKEYGIGIADNVMQEAIIEPLQELTAQTIGGKDKANWDNMGQRMLKSGIDGGLVSAIVGGSNLGISSCNAVVEKINNGQTVTQQDIQTAVKDASKQLDVSQMVVDSTQQQISKFKDYTTGEVLNQNTQNILNQAQNIIQNNQNTQQNQEIIQPQQITQEQNKMAQNGNIEQINTIKDLTKYNMQELNDSNIKIAKTEDLLNSKSNMGKRSNENIKALMEDVKESGFKEPIYISKETNKIVDGNHRLQIAEQLGIDEVPVKYIDSSNDIDFIKNDWYNILERRVKENGGNETRINNIDETNQYESINNRWSNEIINNKRNNAESNQLYNSQQENNNKSSIETIHGQDTSLGQTITNNENSNQSSFSMPTEELVNPYRNTAKANKLIKEKNNKIQQLQNDLKQVNSEETKKILQKEIKNTEKQYNDEIQKLYDEINQKDNITENKPTRHEVIQKNREIARENIKNIANWKDKKRGLSYQLETMERNMYDIIPDKAEAKKMIDTYFEPIHNSEAQKQKFINSYNDRIKEFDLNKYESEAVQVLGEQKYNPSFDKEEAKEVLDRVNKNIENKKINKEKVNNAIEEFRKIYDELFDKENKELRKNGYEEKPYRKGYFPHFIDYVPETKTQKVLEKLGFKIDKRPLPTNIAGITEQFVPGKTWNKSALERKTNKTDYNALKGFDTYIAQASDNIFHTDNIQRLRGLENEIRYQYSDKGIQERIDDILNDETLFAEEKQQLIDNIFEQVENPMPNLVTELRRYTNALANKKSEADRSIENMIGRDVYSTVNAIENRFGANAVGLNMGSAFTNLIPIPQAWSQVSTTSMGRAIIDTVKSYVNDDGFVDKSVFLTSRLKQSDTLYKTKLQKASDKTSILFNAIDEVTSNIVTRGKYLDNIKQGMSEAEAIKDADQFARNVISDRSKGALPTKFEEKNPISKAFTQFQLEVNNQYRYMFKDIPRDLKEKGLGAIALAFFKMFVGAWLYNEASEKITGRRPAFDPIDIVKSAYKDITDKDKTTYDKGVSIGKNIVEDMPFVGGFVGGGRIPISGALPNAGNLTKAGIGLATGEMDSKKALNTIGKEVSKPLYYLLPPFGGAQIKKSVEGINTVKDGGSYGVDSKGQETLQFPVENATAKDYIKAGVFGKYALPLAKNYTESGYKSLNAKQTKTYKESNLPYKEYMEYLKQKYTKTEDKINYLNSKDWGENQKWGIYTNEIFSSTERKDGSTQVDDAKYITNNGTSKTDYMNLYNETNKRNMNLPTKEEYKELKSKGISFESYVDYQTKIHDKTQEKKASGDLNENKQLKNKDKIGVLLNTNYSNKEKEAIYKSSINTQDKKIQLVNDIGFPLEQYLKYRQQDLENDKDKNGDSISGTGKKKTYNYLNSISDKELSQDYKKIICKMQGINAYDSDIVHSILNNKKLNSTKQKEILKLLGFKVNKKGEIKSTTILPISKSVK